MVISTTFHERREIKRKRHFDENPDDKNVATQSTRGHLETVILQLLLIKQLCHLQAYLNNMRLAERYSFLIYFRIIAVIG